MRMLVLQPFHFAHGPATYSYAPGEQDVHPAAVEFAEANGYAQRLGQAGGGMLYIRPAGSDESFAPLGPITSLNIHKEKPRASRHPKTP